MTGAYNRTNSFLDRINNEFFRPRGLFCLLMSYNPIALEKKDAPDEVDAVSKAVSTSPKPAFASRAKRNLRNPVAATVEGEENLPAVTAPLVYLDKTNTDESRSGGNPGEKQKIGDRLNKYFDKRAQARYVSGVLDNQSFPENVTLTDANVDTRPKKATGISFLTPNLPSLKIDTSTRPPRPAMGVFWVWCREGNSLGIRKRQSKVCKHGLSLKRKPSENNSRP